MWIESHQSLRTHRKLTRLTRSLKVSVPAAIGHLHCLWWWCIDNSKDGDLSLIEPEDLAAAAAWDGNPSCLIDSLVYAGFLDRDEDSLTIHNWERYIGKLLEKRAKDAQRKRESRAQKPRP